MSAVTRARSAITVTVLASLLAGGAGCTSAMTGYEPRLVARGELTLRYDDGFEFWSGGQRVAQGYHYNGLPEHVRCVPKASEHAIAAGDDGRIGTTLSALGIVFGVGSLGGLGGLAYYDKNETLMAAWLGTGIALGVTGVVLAALSRGYKNSANGHAVDAMNYYNDAVGSLGASCDNLVYPPPVAEEPPPPAPQVPPPESAPPENAPPANTPPPPAEGSPPAPAPPPSAEPEPAAPGSI